MKFVITVLASVSLANLFVWWASARLLRKGNARWPYRLALHLFMAFQLVAELVLILGRANDQNVDRIMVLPIMIETFIWHFMLLPVAIVHLVLLGGEGIYRLCRYIQKRRAFAVKPSAPTPVHASDPSAATTVPPVETPPTNDDQAPLLSVSRRQFLASAIAFAPPVTSIICSTIASQQIQNFRVRHITVPLPQLPKELDGMTIAHLSDTHVGRFSNGKVLHKIADVTNSLKADLVAVTGDIINDSLRWMPEAIEMFQRIDGPVYLCEGNHDLIDDAFEFRTQMKAVPDVHLLINETRTIMLRGVPLQVLGLRWDSPDRHNKERYRREFTLNRVTGQLLKMANPDLFQIMLAHDPHAWDHAPQVPLTLAGHTHGGQIMLNEDLGFGPMIFRYWTGLYTRQATERNPQSSLVVSNGVGNWFPLRISAPAEIVHLTLKRA